MDMLHFIIKFFTGYENIFLIITTVFSFLLAEAQFVKSPDEFLGYPLGSKYTPHYKNCKLFSICGNSCAADAKG